MRPFRVRSAKAVLLVALVTRVAACSGGSDAAGDSATGDSSADSASTPPFTGALPSAPASAPLAMADIDRWESGMDAELEAVRESAAALRRATTAGDSAMAIIALNEGSTRGAGASGAGVEEDRYQFIRSTFSEAVANLVPLEQVMDVKTMPAEMVAEVRRNRETALAGMSGTLPPELIEALRTRAAELRAQELTLAGERLKAAGLGR
jgi:hypothetical protein